VLLERRGFSPPRLRGFRPFAADYQLVLAVQPELAIQISAASSDGWQRADDAFGKRHLRKETEPFGLR
jgi:hypothetical protein